MICWLHYCSFLLHSDAWCLSLVFGSLLLVQYPANFPTTVVVLLHRCPTRVQFRSIPRARWRRVLRKAIVSRHGAAGDEQHQTHHHNRATSSRQQGRRTILCPSEDKLFPHRRPSTKSRCLKQEAQPSGWPRFINHNEQSLMTPGCFLAFSVFLVCLEVAPVTGPRRPMALGDSCACNLDWRLLSTRTAMMRRSVEWRPWTCAAQVNIFLFLQHVCVPLGKRPAAQSRVLHGSICEPPLPK